MKTVVLLGGALCLAAGPAAAQTFAPEESGSFESQVSAPMSDMEMRTYKLILDMIDQGGPVPAPMLNWAKARINVYVRASLSPQVGQAVEDYIRLGMTVPLEAQKVFEELMAKFEPNMRAAVSAKLKSAENR